MCAQGFSQSSIYVRNSTWQDFEVEAGQYGTFTMDTSEWDSGDPDVRGWLETTGENVLTVNRTNNAVPEGDTAYFDIGLLGATDNLTIKLRIIGLSGGTELDYSVAGPGFSEPWFDDGNFHEVQTTLAGKSVVIKFKPDNDDSNMDRDVRFAIHDLPVYEIDSADYQNPNVMNAMFYNIQMLPFGISGMGQANDRGAFFPAQISANQDVVMFAEVFDTSPREDHLEPAMLAAGFPYKTTILNDPGLIPFPWNGGVMIFSRWPIETEAEIDFEFCGEAAQDCLANKGIKYARVNKLGKKYHIFGTHMDAGGGSDDIFARRTQMAEMRDFIADLNIPDGEPVIFGGDFNVDPPGGDNDYEAFLDTMNPVIPRHIGYWESNFNDNFGGIIDHAWMDRNHLIPTVGTNEIVTFRSLEPVLWDISEFSDHRCVLGRFEYPDIEKVGGDTLICPGESLMLSVITTYPVTYQWFKDGTELNGETSSSLEFVNAQESESGNYTCLVRYEEIYGDWGDSLTAVFYPNGVDTVVAQLSYEYDVVVDEVLCHVGLDDLARPCFSMYPNPSTGIVTIQLNDLNSFGQLRIYSSTGKCILNQTVTGRKS
ncbi:MAG: endonuclease/exonuclease/phosphatase family protein, partial [Flavobacteriales bacterium]|nr:endonuclease/exonuclease/phosphatase family protein [Flavobacteriales bacterium]